MRGQGRTARVRPIGGPRGGRPGGDPEECGVLLARQTGINYTTLSLVENGHRPPTERIAVACDHVFPERNGWYLDYYEDSKSWMPARAHPATASSFMVTDAAGYVEHVLGGGTHTDALSVNALAILFDALRSECYGASESLALVGKARKLWIGEHLRSQARKADSA
jgi:hypothetical protein